MTLTQTMPLAESLQVLRRARSNQVVVSTMSAAREWMVLGTDPLDFIFATSSMGQAPGLGLGIALARPERQVIVLNGDGCMLMNLGALITVTAQAPTNYVLIVFDNGVYEVTGMQPTAASSAERRANSGVDYCNLARSCGFTSIYQFDDFEAWKRDVSTVLAARGPTFVLLRVEAVPGALVPKSPAPAPARALAFKQALES